MEALPVPRTDDLVRAIVKDPNRYIAETRRLSVQTNGSGARWINRASSTGVFTARTRKATTVVRGRRSRRAFGAMSSDARVVLSVLIAGPVGFETATIVMGLWRAAPVAGAAATVVVALAVTVFVCTYRTGRR